MSIRRVLVLAGVVALLATGCSSVSRQATPTTRAPTRVPILLAGKVMEPCSLPGGHVAVCGSLSVYEDRAAHSGRQIDLRVAVIPAEDPKPEPDPVFFLAGGPGDAATENWAWAPTLFPDLHAHRDFVLVDQRGTGGSHGLVFPEAPDVTGLSAAARQARLEQWARHVLAGLDGDPRFYTTSVAMDDLDQVRRALGYDKIDVYGGSYGATAAQYYLRQHGDHVRTMILDGGTLVDVPIFELVARSSQRALDLVFDRCAADVACHGAYPKLRSEFGTIIQRVERHPVRTAVQDPFTGEPVILDRLTLASAVHVFLLDAQTAASLPWAIHQAASEANFDPIAERLTAVAVPPEENPSSLVMVWAIRCSEAWARFDPEATARLGASSYLVDAEVGMARETALGCSLMPRGVVPPNDARAARSDAPVLVLTGEGDPQDPPSNVRDAPVELPNSLSLVVPAQGHGVGSLGCMPTLVAAFVQTGTTNDLEVGCAQQVAVPPFEIGA